MEKGIAKYLIFLLPAALLIVGAFFYFKSQFAPSDDIGRVPEGEGIKIEDRATDLLNTLGVRGDHTVQLHAVGELSGSDAFGVVSWSEADGKISLTVTASLPDPAGRTYYAWLVQGPTVLRIGALRSEKAGYILDFSGDTSLAEYTTVVVSSEPRDGYQITHPVLEGDITFR